MVLLCGTSGSGKSTLASILVRWPEKLHTPMQAHAAMLGCTVSAYLPSSGTYTFLLLADGVSNERVGPVHVVCPAIALQASRLGITTVVSTDSIRHMLRR